jgi:hypothetical protein
VPATTAGPEHVAERVAAALATPARAVQDHLVRATATGLRLAASPLLALHEARRSGEHRMAELLLGGPQTGRDRTVTEPDKAFPGGERSIYIL